jgi:transcriptional regulator with XRE-family HTH domain
VNDNANKANAILRHERVRRGWSQQRVSEQLNTTEDMVSKWERGVSKPSPFYQEKLADLYSLSVEELGLVELAAANTDHLIVATQINTVDQNINDKLEHAESIINLAWEMWFASRPKQAGREVKKLLPSLERMIYTPYLSAHTLHISELVIRGHGLLGTLALDSLQNDDALFHFIQAHKFAEAIRDVELTSTYLAMIGDVLRRQNKKMEAISHMENARDNSVSTSSATHGHILQFLAYTYADTGNETAFEQTIEKATDLLGFTGEGQDAARKEFSPFEIYEIRGKANRDLGKPLKAIPYLDAAEKALEDGESVTPRFQALLSISRGQAYCDAGDLQTGIDLAIQGFLLANKCRSPRQMNRVRKLLRKLEDSPWKNEQKVKDLKEIVYETYANLDAK